MPDTIERAVYELDSSGLVKGAEAGAQAVDRLTVAQRKQDKAQRESAESLEKWIRSADRQLRVVNQYRVDLERLTRYEREEVGTAEQRARALDMLNEKYVKNAR